MNPRYINKVEQIEIATTEREINMMINKECWDKHGKEKNKWVWKRLYLFGKPTPICYLTLDKQGANMKNLILILIDRIRYKYKQEHCYRHRERKGYAAKGCCSALPSTDRSMTNLQYLCYGCKHDD